jgi:hypothetical protein
VSGHRTRFDGIAERYSNFRPSYPDSLLASLTAAELRELEGFTPLEQFCDSRTHRTRDGHVSFDYLIQIL